jgi:hypothetical protein
MSVQISSGSLESHQADLIALFKRYLAPDFDENRFDWLYRQSPYGPARVWVASDHGTGTIVGAAAAFPRSFYFQGTRKMGWVLGDFCLAEQYRSLGPAIQLQRACLNAIVAPYEFCYDFPSKAMMAIYKRLGIIQTSSLVRWAKPLRIENRLESVVRSKSVARTLGRIGNVLLASRGWKGPKDACEVQLHQGPCGEEFTILDQLLGKNTGVRAERTAQYVNWRYLASPSKAHAILVARRNGVLAGYSVVRNEPEGARIVDLVSVDEPAVIARLIDGAVRTSKLGGAKTVSLATGESHTWSRLFERAGFRRRERSPIVVVTSTTTTIKDTDFRTDCRLSEGDRDS